MGSRGRRRPGDLGSCLAVHGTTALVVSLLSPVGAVAQAATLSVGPGQPFANPSQAIAAAASGDVIEIHAGTYPGPLIVDQLDLELVGVDGPDVTVLSAVGPGVVAIDAGLTLRGLSFEATEQAVVVEGGSVVLDAVRVVGSSATVPGAVVHATGADVVVSGGRFEDNGASATVTGGQFWVASGTVTLTHATVVGGIAGSGAQIGLSASTATIEDSLLVGGRAAADGSGGAIHAVDSEVVLSASRLADHEGGLAGGHIAMSGGSLTVTDSTLQAGVAGDGGLVWLDGAMAVLEGVALVGGRSSAGGALSAYGATVTLTDVRAYANQQLDALSPPGIPVPNREGGAVRFWSGTLTVASSAFTGNTSEHDGGAIFAEDASVVVTDSLFAGNSGESGGAIAHLWGDLDVAGSWFVANVADATHGGAVKAAHATRAAFTDDVFLDNDGGSGLSGYGGGVSLPNGDGEVAEFVRNYFCGNEAPGTGGGLYVESWSGPVSLRNNVFADNDAPTGGGAYGAPDGGELVVHNNDFLGNSAAIHGGYGFEASSLTGNLFGWNTPSGASNTGGTVGWSAFWANGASFGFSTSPATGVFSADPLLVDYVADRGCLTQSFERQAGTPLLDAGDPSWADPDGSVSDVGAFGGPDAGVGRLADEDGDGHPGYRDCAPADPAIHPVAVEVCNQRDDDCDGEVDEAGAGGALVWFVDADLDGYGDDSVASVEACDPPDPTWTLTAGDCDDTDARRNPSALLELCDDVDDDCDGGVDEDAFDAVAWWVDSDEDGFGTASEQIWGCDQPADASANALDCDDDAFDVNPAAPERCNGLDDDCDLYVDEDDAVDALAWSVDLDLDGFGAGPVLFVACSGGYGTAPNDLDCDNLDAATWPGADELCDGEDQDCDGVVDEEAVDASDWFLDLDGDGYGDPSDAEVACSAPAGRVADDTDCDDDASTVHPSAPERCDGVDEDCDLVVDDDPVDGLVVYEDGDGDGYGDALAAEAVCSPSSSQSLTNDDCDDADPAAYPGAVEVAGDGVDSDCDGLDGGGSVGEQRGDETADATGGCGCSSADTSSFGLAWVVAAWVCVGARRRRGTA